MGNINYSDCSQGYKYGEDGRQLSNWNPDLDYGNEYVNVYFRIAAIGYDYPDFSFSKEEAEAFDKEVASVFTELGWKCESEDYNGRCSTWKHGKSHLYLHPQNFSGEVLKNEIKTVAEALLNRTSFKLRWVDLYETVYDMTDGEYEELLKDKETDIREAVLVHCKTKRRNLFFNVTDVLYSLTKRFSVPRIGVKENQYGSMGQTSKFILHLIEDLIEHGYLISVASSGRTLVRTINKTEQKQRKLYVA